MADIQFAQVVALAKKAGEEIMTVYAQDFDVYTKEDKSPLTEADLLAHKVIVEGLAQITPDVPVLSEENADIDWSERKQWRRYWLVDPIDGTKEFIKKNGEFTVNIALIDNGKPVWGVVDAPALGKTYVGGTAVDGAWVQDADSKTQIHAPVMPTGQDGWRVVGSRSHQSDEFKAFVEQYNHPEIKSMGSSLKICLIAEGEADIYPRLGPTSEWDTGAAHAVLLGAGGDVVIHETDDALTYNQKESVLNPFFIAKGKAA